MSVDHGEVFRQDDRSMSARAERSLVVEDTPQLRETLETVLWERSDRVESCPLVAEAIQLLPSLQPDLVVLDLKLPDGTGFDVLDAIAQLPAAPIVVAISGTADPEEAFRLAERGVRAYLDKPLDLDVLERTLDRALSEPPDLTPHVRSAVGQVGIHELEEKVRRTMVEEAINRSGGNRRAAARLLEVSRQLIQQMLRRLE